MSEETRAGALPREVPACCSSDEAVRAEVIAGWIKQPIAEVGCWLGGGSCSSAGLVLLCVAVVFILIGGVQGLQQLNVPPGRPGWAWARRPPSRARSC